MIREYHQRVTFRATKAAATGHFGYLFGIWRESILWTLPALVAVLICWAFDLGGLASLWATLPAVGIWIAGAGLYIPSVYLGAMKRRANDS
jgi:hypothetical protein